MTKKKLSWLALATGFLIILCTSIFLREEILFITKPHNYTRSHQAETKRQKVHVYSNPLPLTKERRDLTLEYIQEHYDRTASNAKTTPRMIVIHWTASNSLYSTLMVFAPTRIPFWRKNVRAAGHVNVSSHYIVDRDGSVYQLLPETFMARHVIGLNRAAIGIENVGGPSRPLTESQLISNASLIRHLQAKFPEIKYLIGHHEYEKFKGSALWEENDPNYLTKKEDPGDEFMTKLRAMVDDLNLRSSPSQFQEEDDF